MLVTTRHRLCRFCCLLLLLVSLLQLAVPAYTMSCPVCVAGQVDDMHDDADENSLFPDLEEECSLTLSSPPIPPPTHLVVVLQQSVPPQPARQLPFRPPE